MSERYRHDDTYESFVLLLLFFFTGNHRSESLSSLVKAYQALRKRNIMLDF